MTLAEKLSSRPSRDANVNQELTGDGGKEVVEAESGEVTTIEMKGRDCPSHLLEAISSLQCAHGFVFDI